MGIDIGGKLPTAAGAYVAPTVGSFGVDKLGLPENMDLASLMSWLTTRMRDSDAAIRSRMADVSGRKEIQKKLSDLTIAFRESMKGADQGDGKVAVAPPLDNPQAIRNSDWFKALDPATRKQVESMLNMIEPAGYFAGADITLTYKDGSEYVWKKGEPITAEALAAHPMLAEASKYKREARINKDEIERAVQTLGDISKNASSNDEIQMIELQSAISARGQLLQLVSNMIGSFHDTAKSIVGNIRG